MDHNQLNTREFEVARDVVRAKGMELWISWPSYELLDVLSDGALYPRTRLGVEHVRRIADVSDLQTS